MRWFNFGHLRGLILFGRVAFAIHSGPDGCGFGVHWGKVRWRLVGGYLVTP